MQFNRGITFVLFIIFFLLAVIGIMNTMLMAVFERTRELGMLMALGMRPFQVIGLILAEAAGFGGCESGSGSGDWRSGSLVFAGSWAGPGRFHRRGDFSCRSGGGPPMVRPAGFYRLRSGGCGAGRDSDCFRPLSRVAGCSLSADGSDPQGLAVTSVLLLLKISWRNLWRNPRGTLLTALALGLGLALLLISLGLLDGGHEQMVADGVRLGTGHVVIQAKGYQDTGSQELLLAAPAVSTAEKFVA